MIREKSVNKARLAVLAAFFTNGSLVATWVSRIPAIQTRLGLSEGALGLVLLGMPIGLLAALFLVSGWIARLGSKKIVLIFALVSALSLPLLAIAPHPVLLFILLAIFGGGISAMDVAMNEQAVLVEKQTGKPMMSSFHAGYSIGGVAGALLSSIIAALPIFTPFIHFAAISLVFSILTIWSYQYLVPTQAQRREKEPVFRLPERALWILGMVAFAGSWAKGYQQIGARSIWPGS